MNNAYIWSGVGLVVVAVGAYLAFGGAGKVPAGGGMATTTLQSQQMSMRELAMSNTPQKCAFTSANNTQGIVYVANAKVRGDFSAEVNGSAIVGHTIVRDNTSYVWMDGMSQGFKNSFEATAEASSSQSSQGLNPDERVSYSCSAWSADESLFTLPTTVEFRAISAAQVQTGAGAVGASCSQCDMIPDAGAKAQCKAALHC